jgi:radical SAM protein with 4Fe4S-binding SPASM domain
MKRTYNNLLRKTGLRPGPLVVNWLSTYRCNSSCLYCEASANEPKCVELTSEQIKKVIDELHALKTRHFFVTGGEPLMRKDLFDILQYAKHRKMTVGMITNSLLFAHYKEEIKQAEFKSIWTSVDGLEATHDKNRGYPTAYNITLEAIRYYSKLEIPLRVVNTMVHPGNYDELPALFEELKAAGITRWRLALAIPVGRASKDDWALPRDKIEKIFKYVTDLRKNFDVELSEELGYLGCLDLKTKNTPFSCPSGLWFCVIMPDGHVLPCQVAYDTKYSEGNVLQTPFVTIWQDGFRPFRTGQLEGDCCSCIHRRACGGGCWGRRINKDECLRGIWDLANYGNPT